MGNLAKFGTSFLRVGATLGRADVEADCCCGGTFEYCGNCDTCPSSVALGHDEAHSDFVVTCGAYEVDVTSCFAEPLADTLTVANTGSCTFINITSGWTALASTVDKVLCSGGPTVTYAYYRIACIITCWPSDGIWRLSSAVWSVSPTASNGANTLYFTITADAGSAAVCPDSGAYDGNIVASLATGHPSTGARIDGGPGEATVT